MSNSADWVTNRTGEPRPAVEPPAREPARLWRRLTAAAYDALLLTALFFLVTAIVVASQRSGIPAGAGWFQLLLAATAWLYFAWCWVHGGQTVGMRAWKIRVVAAETTQPVAGWGRASLRFFLAFAPAAPLSLVAIGVDRTVAAGFVALAYAVGYGASLLRQDRACWHDLGSRTCLLRTAD